MVAARRRIQLNLMGPEAKDRSARVSIQETLNLRHVVKGTGAKSPVILESAPGLVDLGQAGNGACRLAQLQPWRNPVSKNRELFGVFGQDLVQFTTTGGPQALTPQLDPLTSQVRAARGRTMLVLVDGSFGWTYNGTVLAKITDADFPDQSGSGTAGRPTHVVYKDGVFVVNDADTDNFYISALEDGTDWNALDFEAASYAPDNSLALAKTESLMWILGDETAQPYYTSGNPDFPFSLVINGTQEVGIAAPQSIADSRDGVYFVATTPEGGLFVYRIIGTQGQVISQNEQADQLEAAPDIGNAYGFMYNQADTPYYVLQVDPNLPSLLYNIRAGLWESRALIDGSGWRIGGTGKLGTDLIGGSRVAGRYYRIDENVFNDAGQSFIRRRRTQAFHQQNALLEWWEVVLDCQTGVGNQMPPGNAPVIQLRYSDDNGQTWSDYLPAELGAIGEQGGMVSWRNLGQSRQRVYEFQISDPVELTIAAMYADVEMLVD